jgi:hypothetical protein
MKKRPDDFKRILLMGFQDKVSHVKLEAEMLQAVDAAHNPLYYNQHNEDGHFSRPGGWSHSIKSRNLISQNNPMNRPDIRAKHKVAIKEAMNRPEVRIKSSEAKKRWWQNKKENDGSKEK